MASVAQRRRTEAAAGKERRKKIFAILGICVLVVVGVIQVPKTLDLLSSDTAAAPAPAPSITPGATLQTPPHALRLLRGSGTDPFVRRSLSSGDPGPLAVAGPAGARDPFTPAPVNAVLAPKRIIIGTPSAGRTPTVGYIVVLASIRTAAGRGVAERIARSARRDGLGNVAVLDSSTRRPLRSGYYVAYAGPYSSGSAVRDAANRAHALGYRTAYIRELVRY